jgi:hypothetical protein
MDLKCLDEMFDNTNEIRERREKKINDCKDTCRIYAIAYNQCINKQNDLHYDEVVGRFYYKPITCKLQQNLLYECCKHSIKNKNK